jgi:DNA polymerase V
LTVGYDVENLINPETSRLYSGPVTTDMYGRKVPKHAHGTTNLGRHTSSTKLIIEAVSELYDRIVDKNLLIRRVTVTANHLLDEKKAMEKNPFVQLDLFTDYSSLQKKLEREKQMQRAILGIKKKYGKNAILKGMNLIEGATTKERNDQIGGHRA